MSKASELRAFAISVERIIRMLPALASKGALRKAEADLLTRQLKPGVEVALDIALTMQAAPNIQPEPRERLPLDTAELIAATKALLPILVALRHTVGLGKTQLERIERARVAIHAAETATADRAHFHHNGGTAAEGRGQGDEVLNDL